MGRLRQKWDLARVAPGAALDENILSKAIFIHSRCRHLTEKTRFSRLSGACVPFGGHHGG